MTIVHSAIGQPFSRYRMARAGSKDSNAGRNRCKSMRRRCAEQRPLLHQRDGSSTTRHKYEFQCRSQLWSAVYGRYQRCLPGSCLNKPARLANSRLCDASSGRDLSIYRHGSDEPGSSLLPGCVALIQPQEGSRLTVLHLPRPYFIRQRIALQKAGYYYLLSLACRCQS